MKHTVRKVVPSRKEPGSCQRCNCALPESPHLDPFRCFCADGPWYCSRQCQLSDWDSHQEQCENKYKIVQLKHNRRAESLLNIMDAEFVLGGTDLDLEDSALSSNSPQETEQNYSPLLEAKAILKILATSSPCDRVSTCNKALWVPLLQRLMCKDRHLLRALLSQEDDPEKDDVIHFLCIDVLEQLLESDVCMLNNEKGCYASPHCHNKRLSPNDEWFIPSCRVALDLLRAVPEEESFSLPSVVPPTNKAASWSLIRTIIYVSQWENHINVCSVLMNLVCSDQAMPTPWIKTCVELWEQLLAALSHPKVACEVLWEADEALRRYSETPQVGLKQFFKPLLNVLKCLKWRQESMNKDRSLLELGYQVAALVIAQSYRLESLASTKPEEIQFDLHSAYLERVFVSYLSVPQCHAWNTTYLPWAAEVAKRSAEDYQVGEKDNTDPN